MIVLSPDDFSAFFQEVHGLEPFPWQNRLLRQVAQTGNWPETLDLPTGSGKTAAIDIAVFHLALEAGREDGRSAPVRIAFVVDRRLVVDDAFARAEKLAGILANPPGPLTVRVAEQLRQLSGDGPALIARRLRGGIPREGDWARTPTQPTVLCSTVDQVGSRLLFRGYGVSDSMKPVHAGLIGSDCLILLDEAHLAEPFRQTLGWVGMYRGPRWREVDLTAPWGVTLLTATLGEKPQDGFSLDDEDRSHPVFRKRLDASKPAHLVAPLKSKGKAEDAAEAADDEAGRDENDLMRRVTAIVAKVQAARAHFKKSGGGNPPPAIGVVVNRVARARAVHARLSREISEEEAECILLIGPARPVDREDIASQLAPIRTGAERTLDKPLILVATQCIEAGVDIDLDALVTEVAPLDSLRQRFGRLNRAGRDILPYAAILAAQPDVRAREEDPVYGRTIKPAWDLLMEEAKKRQGRDLIVDFGLSAFAVPMESDAISPKADAPILLPAHLDLLSQTSPIPAADPDVALYLHGPNRQPDSITLIWRADIDPVKHRNKEGEIRRLLTLVSPRSAEAIELPLWAVRRWLMGGAKTPHPLADIVTIIPEEVKRLRTDGEWRVFRWKGNDDDRSRWIAPSELRPGDTIIVPAGYGGVDEFGWNPESDTAATDVAAKASEPFAGRWLAVRVAPGVIGNSTSSEALADSLAGADSQRWRDLRAALEGLSLPDDLRKTLDALDKAKAGKIAAYTDLYGNDDEGRPRGVVFVAPFGIRGGRQVEDGQPSATEDDVTGSIPGFLLTLAEHSEDVETKAKAFAKAASLPPARVADLRLAGYLHDAGKVDRRFQAWLHYSDPFGPDLNEPGVVIAESDRPLPRAARAESGLPENWRHEAFSVRLAPHAACFAEADDAELVLWLIGTHHGHGRPFFPHHDPEDTKPRVLTSVIGLPSVLPPGPGPQSLAFDWNSVDWPTLFMRLKARYGVWELARMEAILRLADHRASADRATNEGAK